MNKRSGMYPRLRVDSAAVPAVAQAGGVLLTRTVETSGLGILLSRALGPWRKSLARHDPAKVLLDLAISLALGGDACRDAALLRSEPGVYGRVASDATISRTITALAADVDRVEKAVAQATAAARQHVWGLAGEAAPGHGASAGDPIIIDLDATLVTSHSDKELARPTFKKGYGFPPAVGLRRPRPRRDRRTHGRAAQDGQCRLQHRRRSRDRHQGCAQTGARDQPRQAGQEGADPY